MDKLFLTVLNMSLTGSYIIMFVILLRVLLKKAPKSISYGLWSVVGIRLIFPFTFHSIWSLLPRSINLTPIPLDIGYQESPRIYSGVEVLDSIVSQSLPVPKLEYSVNPLQIYVEIATNLWMIGMILLSIYSVLSILRLKSQLRDAQVIEGNIWEKEHLQTPFVLGFIEPKIYLPKGLNPLEREYVLQHEKIHIQRKDHIIKMLAFCIVIIHWFNPLVWIAFILMSMDMEFSCDEKVLKDMDGGVKKQYAHSLLSFAMGRHFINGNPLAFGEGNVKERIKNVLKYKQPRRILVLFAIILVVVAGIGLLSNPKVKTNEPRNPVEELWESQTKYLGDNSKVGKILYQLPLPNELKHHHFALETKDNQRGLEWVLDNKANEGVTLEEKQILSRNALYLFALIENVENIRIKIQGTRDEIELNYNRTWADTIVQEDIRKYSSSSEKLDTLKDIPLSSFIENDM